MNSKSRYLRNREGFTLLEVMVSLSITSLCFILLSTGVRQIKTVREQVKNDNQIEWHLFMNQLEYYLQDSRLVDNYGDRLVVQEFIEGKHETVQYMHTGNFFIRRYNSGTQPLLTNVSQVYFTVDQDDLLVEGRFYNGEKYQAHIGINNEEVLNE